MPLGLGMAVGLGMCLWLLRGADEERPAVQIRQTVAGYDICGVKFANVCCLVEMCMCWLLFGVKQIILRGMQHAIRFGCELCTLSGTAFRVSTT